MTQLVLKSEGIISTHIRNLGLCEDDANTAAAGLIDDQMYIENTTPLIYL